MSFKRCPGSLSFAQPKIELVRCAKCGEDAEVWTDEASGKCSKCGEIVCRTTTQSCIDWCKYAKECLGADEHKRYQDMKTRLRKETLLKAGESFLTDDQKTLARARVKHAEQLLSREPNADPNVVIAAATLFDISPAASQGTPSSTVADILQDLGYPEGFIKEVATIAGHTDNPSEQDSVNGRLVREADKLARSK
jgi:hypothetical protein